MAVPPRPPLAPFPCIDAHVHLHPPGLARAIERWFAGQRWIAGHVFEPSVVADTLRARGVERFCFFSYAHKPGMSRELNRWLAKTAAALPEALALGTLHVFVLHVGTMPYRDAFTGVERFARVMARFPRLRVCVAHMGAFQSAEFLALLARYPHLYVDTTMAMTPLATPFVGADPAAVSDADLVRHQDRIMFGSDFPLIPYDYDEERRWAWERGLTDDVRRKILHDNARAFFQID